MRARVGNRTANGDRGAVLPIVALSLAVLMAMTAFSVDLGRQMVHRRQAQGVADVVALDMARMIDGRTRSAIESDPQWDQTRRDAAARNNWSESGVVATLGTWDPATKVFTPSGPSDVPNAVQIATSGSVDFYFARVIGLSQGSVNRTSIATQDVPGPPPDYSLGPWATGALGSVAAGFRYYLDPSVTAQYNASAEERANILNSALYVAFGINGAASTAPPPVGLNLDAVSYQGIANGYMTLGDIATSLGFGSVSDLLAATITARDLLNAEVNALKKAGNTADVAAANKIASFSGSASSSLFVRLGDFIKIAQGDQSRAAGIKLNALNVMTGSAQLINGKNFFSTSVFTKIPGAGTIPMRVAIIQPAQIATNQQGSGPCPPQSNPGCGPRTAQVRIAFDIPTTLDLTPYGIAVVQATTIPVVFEAASAQGLFSAIRCGEPLSNSTTDFRVLTNGVSMTIGSVSDASLQSTTSMTVQPQSLLTGLALVSGITEDLGLGTKVGVTKTFKNDTIYSGDVYSNLNALGNDETHTFTGNTIDNITPTSWRYYGGVGNTSVSTTLFNSLGITDSNLNAAVSGALKTSLANLDQLLMDPSLSAYGMTLAGADGSINKVDCNVHLVK